MKRLTSLWLALLFLLVKLTGCAQDVGLTRSADGSIQLLLLVGLSLFRFC